MKCLGKSEGHYYKTYADIHKCLGNVNTIRERTWVWVSNLVMNLIKLAPNGEHDK
jgi:hypothetical protein